MLIGMSLALASLSYAASTLSFQNGANGYAGAKDIAINTQYAQYNGGNGVRWTGDAELGCYTTTGSGAYSVRYLLRFDALGIAPGTQVTSATLTLSLDSWESGAGNITGFYLKNSWDPASTNTGWIHRDASRDWATAGASSAGVDTVAQKSFQIPALRPVGVQTVTITLDPSVVQSWVDSPTANQGIMLVNNNPGEIIRPVSVAGTQKNRPKLTIVVGGASSGVQVSVSPTSASVQAGLTKQFTATVTGSSNTALNWSATGGTISNSGLFTAGSTAGNFTVMATSVADSSKTASASVTIASPPPTVSVNVAPTSVSLQPGQTQQFTATVTGSSNTSVIWSATGGAISTSGFYTAGQVTGSFSVTATSSADSTKSTSATVVVKGVSSFPPVPRMSDGAYVVVQSPVSGMHFTAPATIRIYADPFDPNAADPDALTVTFLMNGQSLGTFTGSGNQNGYFALTASNVSAGTYSISAQITAQGKTVSSAPVTVFVSNPVASSGPVFNLTSDVVLSGAQNASYAGSAANHCTINGNGFQIRSAAGFTGSLTINNCDIRGLGTARTPAIDVTANGSGSIQLTGNTFDTFGTVSIGANNTAQAIVRNNEFRENTLVPVTQLPIAYAGQTLPVFQATGNSTVPKFFQGNNVGLSTVFFQSTQNWLIGGNTDAESNVLMGVRCGFTVENSTNMVLRGNYSQHNYPHRFSQGENFELVGDGFLVEHNVIRSSSWPVRGMGGELRYNLIDASGNSDQIIQGPLSNTNMHHNVIVFTVSQTLYSPGTGLRVMYTSDNVQFHNNVMDGGGALMNFSGSPVSVLNGAFISSLRNNVFYNFAASAGMPILTGDFGESTNPPLPRLRYSDYNDFYNPLANQTNYGLGVVGLTAGAAGFGMHDLGGFNGHINPKFAQPTAIPFPFLPEDIWNRVKKVSDVLATYRSMYTPASGSPLIAAGDPQDGAGGNIGAVGNGEAADHFGKFGNGTSTPPPPPTVSISISPISASVAAGATKQFTATVTGSSNTAATWTASGGTVSSSGLLTAGSAAGSFSVTATSVADTTKSASASVTVTVSAPQPVSITVSPTSTALFAGGTQQFTATVKNASNTSVTWSASGGTISASGLYTAGSATGSFTVTATSVQDTTKNAPASVTIVNQTTTGRPRIILDAPTLATLRSRMQAKTAEWTRIKSTCDSYVGGNVEFINGNDYPDRPNVGEGYQGSGYIETLMPLGLCYQTMLASDPATALKYGTKAVAILMAMSDPAHQTADDCNCNVPLRDDGYGMRNFGVGMGIGYDWFHDLMTPAQLTQLQTALAQWFTTFETDPKPAFEYEHPQGNYFAGYYAAKCMAALAVQGDAPIGDTWWSDWYNHQHLQRVAPYYTANLGGGGWLEGYAQYGILSVRNQSLPALAVRTAKGIDIINDPAHPYKYPLDNAQYLMHFTWPTKDIIDDRGELYSTGDPTFWPGTGSVDAYRFAAGFLALWNDPAAPMMHRYARDAKTALDAVNAGGTTEWIDFLFWDPNAPEASDYSSLPLSDLAPGIGGVAARSDGTSGATFRSFRAGPYLNNPGAGHESFEKGSVALERNKNPFLVNPAWLAHEPNGDQGWNLTYDDRFGNWDADHTLGNRRLYNTFQVRHLNSTGGILDNYGEWAVQRTDGVRTKISRYEDGGAYVLATGQFLEDMYRPFQTICAGVSPITSWSRQIVYLRPSQFVVYDRTGICNSSLDQYLAWHFAANPVEVAAPGTGLHRFDVNTGTFAGSMTTILPANAATVTTSQLGSDTAAWNKMWRTEIRATDAPNATRRWMTVFDMASSASQVAAATPVNVLSGSAVGVVLASASGNSVVISGTAPLDTAIAGTLSYNVPAAQTRHVITDLAASSGYTVSVSVGGGTQTVTVAAGGGRMSTSNGVLTFQVSASGQVAP